MAPVKKDVVDANGDQWALAPETYVSNGPLKMIEWVPGSHMTFAKNENYWNADKVTLNSLKFVLMEDSNAAYSAYQTGEVQMIKDIPTEEIPSLQDSPDYHLDPRLATSYTIFNLSLIHIQMCIRDSVGTAQEGTGEETGADAPEVIDIEAKQEDVYKRQVWLRKAM